VNWEFSTFVLRGNKDRNYGTDKATIIEGVNGVNRLATKGEKILLTTDKTEKEITD